MDAYHQRKAERSKQYADTLGWKKRTCTACSGSGRYDHNGSPKCGACNGTGKERYRPTTKATP